MRYRLISTRGRSATMHFEADAEHHALNIADGLALERNERLVLCAAPRGGLVRELEIVGELPEKPKGQR